MKKFLLIDDEKNSVTQYRNFFSFLEIEYLENPNKFQKYIKSKYDGYIVDVVYDDNSDYGMAGLTFEEVIKVIPMNSPIYIVSKYWQDVMNENKMRILYESSKKNNVLGLFSWESIRDDVKNTIKDFAKFQYRTHFGFASQQFEDNEPVLILQISDLEFGNEKQTEYINTSTQDFLSKIRNEVRKLNSDRNGVDFLIICGDIANLGRKEEFYDAAKWIKAFADEIIEGDSTGRVLLVPGNHDYCIDAAMGNFYSCFWSKEKHKFVTEKRKDTITQFEKLGFNNYYQFYTEVCHPYSKQIYSEEPKIIRDYEESGFIFILLNIVRFSDSFEYNLSDDVISKIMKDLGNVSEDTTIIIVSHSTPAIINKKDPTAGGYDTSIETFANNIKPHLWIYGHAHEKKRIDDERIASDKKTILSQSTTLLVSKAGQCENGENGYTILQLNRNENKVVSVSYLMNNRIEECNTPWK